MTRSIFDREVFFKIEQIDNPFIAARALSLRARHVNAKKQAEKDKDKEDQHYESAPAIALEDYIEGRIAFNFDRREPRNGE